MWRHIASNAMTLFIVLLFLAAGLVVWGSQEYSAEGPLETAICLRVEQGSNMRRVSQDLDDQSAISSATLFRLGADYSDKSQQLKAGSFLVPAGASMEGIVDLVTRGGQSTCGTEIVYRIGVTRSEVQVRELDPSTNRYVEQAAYNPTTDEAPAIIAELRDKPDTRYRVALAEGVTSWQVVQGLNGIDGLESPINDIPAEGSLAPDSYEFTPGTSVANLLADMADSQNDRLAAAWAGRASDLPYATPQEALIMASIVEKETGVSAERRQVASVFVNRLNQGMRLQTDPTVIYGITNGEGILGRGLRQSELRAQTPFNTYVIDGLPPSPIANPGLASIEAAMHPDDTAFIFFVADGTGGHAFATNLDDHNSNVARWRQIEADRAASEGN